MRQQIIGIVAQGIEFGRPVISQNVGFGKFEVAFSRLHPASSGLRIAIFLQHRILLGDAARQPPADIAPARNRGEIVKLMEQSPVGQHLQRSKAERGAADTASREAEGDRPLARFRKTKSFLFLFEDLFGAEDFDDAHFILPRDADAIGAGESDRPMDDPSALFG